MPNETRAFNPSISTSRGYAVFQPDIVYRVNDPACGIVTGAPLTGMMSMYNSVYWNTGTADMAIVESSQGRFKGSYLDYHLESRQKKPKAIS